MVDIGFRNFPFFTGYGGGGVDPRLGMVKKFGLFEKNWPDDLKVFYNWPKIVSSRHIFVI